MLRGKRVLCVYDSYLLSLFQEDNMPEEVNIDDLIDLPNDEERARKLQVTQKVKLECARYLQTIVCNFA